MSAASRLVAYGTGYMKKFRTNSIIQWDDHVMKEMTVGCSTCVTVDPKHIGSMSINHQVESKHLGSLHHIFRLALDIKGFAASFSDVAYQMNQISSVLKEVRPTTHLTRTRLSIWFLENKIKFQGKTT